MKTILLAACLTLTACVGATPSKESPRYTTSHHDLWDRGSKFRKLTDAERPGAQEACDKRGFGRALGIHPATVDENGRAIGEGVLCQHNRPMVERSEKR